MLTRLHTSAPEVLVTANEKISLFSIQTSRNGNRKPMWHPAWLRGCSTRTCTIRGHHCLQPARTPGVSSRSPYPACSAHGGTAGGPQSPRVHMEEVTRNGSCTWSELQPAAKTPGLCGRQPRSPVPRCAGTGGSAAGNSIVSRDALMARFYIC